MKKLIVFLIPLLVLGCGNPSVDSGYFAYCKHEPMMIGKASFEGILKGPTSYGFSWRISCNKQEQFSNNKITESFQNEKKSRDLRILSLDEINLAVNVNLVVGFKHSGVFGVPYDAAMFESSAKKYFEQYYYVTESSGKNVEAAWKNNFSTPFRQDVRLMIGQESYKTAKQKREEIAIILFKKWTDLLKDTPFHLYSVSINTINPPERIMNEEEASKAVDIANTRQVKENRLKLSQGSVMAQEAKNLRNALAITPKYLEWKKLEMKNKYADGFEVMSKGKSFNNVEKILVVPYGTNVNPGL